MTKTYEVYEGLKARENFVEGPESVVPGPKDEDKTRKALTTAHSRGRLCHQSLNPFLLERF